MRTTAPTEFLKGRLLSWPVRAAALIVVAPPVVVFFKSAFAGLGADESSGGGVFSWPFLLRSVGLSAAASVVATAGGTFAGLTAARLSRRGALAMAFLFALPLSVGPPVHAYLWRNLAMSAGLLGGLFAEGGSTAVNYSGAVLSLVSAYWPIAAFAAFAMAAGPVRNFEAQARTLVPASVAVRKVVLPTLIPVAAAAGGLVFILSFGEYGAPALWQVNTYPVRIQALYSSFFEPERAAAAALVPAAVTALAALGVFAFGRRALKGVDLERANVEAEVLWHPGRLMRLGLVGFVLFLLGLPVGMAAYWTVFSGTNPSDIAAAFGDLVSTLVVAGAAAAAATALALLAAGANWPRARGWRNALLIAAVIAFLLPEAAMGLATKTIFQWRFVPRALSVSGAAFGYALAGRFFVISLALCAVALERLDRRYRDLSTLYGSGGWRKFASTALPVMLPAAVAAWIVTVVLSLAQLPLGILLAAPGRPVVAVDLFNLMHYARRGEAFAVALGMMFGAAIALFVVVGAAGKVWKRYLQTA